MQQRLGADVFTDAIGFKVVTAFKASQVFEEHRRKVAEAEERVQRNRAQVAKAARDAHARTPKRFTKFDLQTVTINPNASDVPPVVQMTANAPAPDYDGSVMTRRPGAVDWIGGDAEGGQQIGPTRKQMEKAAAARKAERLAAKQQPIYKKGI
jgi:uncharacterized membrane protein YccC